MDPTEVRALASAIRISALRMVHRASSSHIGSCLSAADILAVLYGGVMKVSPANRDDPERDHFILSKGHAAAILYAVLAHRGFFPLQWLDDYCQNGSLLAGHAVAHVPGVEISTGSLGHGLPIGCGLALAAKRDGRRNRVFVVLSDGELDEGSNWEAILFAPQHRLDNLAVIVDCNKIQSLGDVSAVLDLEPLADKWRAFRWNVREIDGHDHEQIESAVSSSSDGKPIAVIAHTVKGKGVSFMEGKLAWHYKSPTAEQLEDAIREISLAP